MARITRVSPPELERELPGPQASSRVTRAPRASRASAVQPPKAPAPTTAMCGRPPAAAPAPGELASTVALPLRGMGLPLFERLLHADCEHALQVVAGEGAEGDQRLGALDGVD